jgi:hypothetical protein
MLAKAMTWARPGGQVLNKTSDFLNSHIPAHDRNFLSPISIANLQIFVLNIYQFPSLYKSTSQWLSKQGKKTSTSGRHGATVESAISTTRS